MIFTFSASALACVRRNDGSKPLGRDLILSTGGCAGVAT
jgi:hypothetical protein